MNRLSHFDYARAFAILCVVISHTSLAYVFNTRDIIIDVFIHNFVGIGVPLFLFMAGFFVKVKQNQSLFSFMQDKITRIYIPTVIWTIFFNVLLSIVGTSEGLNPQQLLSNILFLSDPFFYYFTFVIMLLFLFGYFIYRLNTDQLRRVVQISFVLGIVMIALYEIAFFIMPKGTIFPSVVMYRNPLVWVFFFAYGMYTSRTNYDLLGGWFNRFKVNKYLGLGIAAILLFITSLETLVLYDRTLPGAQDYFKVASFFLEIIAIHYVFIFLKTFNPPAAIDRGLKTIAKYSFFIYLVHMPTVEKLIGTTRLMSMSKFHYVGMAIESALCFLIPLIAVYIIRWFSRVAFIKAGAKYIGIPNI